MIENKQPAITWKIYEIVIGEIILGAPTYYSCAIQYLLSNGYIVNNNAGQVQAKMKKEEGKTGKLYQIWVKCLKIATFWVQNSRSYI